MKSSIYGYNSNNDKLVMLVALCYTKDINCLIYIFSTTSNGEPLVTWLKKIEAWRRRCYFWFCPSEMQTMFNGLKGSVLAFSYQLSHQTEEGAWRLQQVRDNLPLIFWKLQQTLLADKSITRSFLWFSIGTRNLVFRDKACRLLCYAFFVLSLSSRIKKEGDISMIRGEVQVFPSLNCRHAEERLRTGVRDFPRSL